MLLFKENLAITTSCVKYGFEIAVRKGNKGDREVQKKSSFAFPEQIRCALFLAYIYYYYVK